MQVQQISDFGTTNPIVARLSIQTQELLKYFDITDEQRQQIFAVMFSRIQPNLLACWKTATELGQAVKSHQKTVDDKGIEIVGRGAFRIPSIADLQPRAEAFLYQAKTVLRDLTKVFAILFGKQFDGAHFHLVVRWAKGQFGATDELTTMLQSDLEWTKRIVDMRNAVEHPGGYAGHLHIEKFTTETTDATIVITEPQWYLNAEAKCSITYEMSIFVDNLLTLCEQTLLPCLQKFKKDLPILIGEVSEANRDPDCPIRYKMMIDTSKVKWPPVATAPAAEKSI